VSAVAVDLGRRWILVDCGEGTQHQILRAPLSTARLEAILITHLHGDHVLGLPGLLASLGLDGRTDALPVVGPAGLAGWLDATTALPMLHLTYPVEVTELADGPAATDEPDGSDISDDSIGRIVLRTADGVTVETRPLLHRVPCHGYRISAPTRPGRFDAARAAELGVAPGPDAARLVAGESVEGSHGTVHPDQVVGPPRPGQVVTVLGDTVPCNGSVALARGSDVLVHEATYADAETALAARWMHSTARQAGEIAGRSGARHLVLTHFSARYPDLSVLLAEAQTVFPATTLAEELTWVWPIDSAGDR